MTATSRQAESLVKLGRGIANPDNLFVPFYSTQRNGQGIGLSLSLSLSRHMVEQMGGLLSLSANASGGGACAGIELPPIPRPIADDGRPQADHFPPKDIKSP